MDNLPKLRLMSLVHNAIFHGPDWHGVYMCDSYERAREAWRHLHIYTLPLAEKLVHANRCVRFANGSTVRVIYREKLIGLRFHTIVIDEMAEPKDVQQLKALMARAERKPEPPACA